MSAEAWLAGGQANPQQYEAPAAGYGSIVAAGTEAGDTGAAAAAIGLIVVVLASGTEVADSGAAVAVLPAPIATVVAAGTEQPDAGSSTLLAVVVVTVVAAGTEAADAGSVGLRSIGPPALTAAQQAEVLHDSPIVKLPDEILVFVFDFAADLLPAETITRVERVVTTAVGSEDPNPDAIRLGPPQVTPQALFQFVEAGVNGVNYLMAATVDTTTGRRLKGELTVRVRQATSRPTRRV